jgi:energy-coupling factor transporter ATP-binding protein EcfA2
MSDLLTCNSISYRYRSGKRLALNKVDFSVAEGEFIGIVGTSEAGKSTLVRCFSGIVPKFFRGPFAGEVLLKGRSIAGKRVADLAGIVGTLFQDFESQLFSTNVYRELAFGMENLSIDRASMLRRVKEVLQIIGLSGFAEREPQSLSGGQKQRLALGSVLCLKPDLLVCDEPTTDLDPVGRKDLLDILDRLISVGHSVVLVEHNTERLAHANRIIVMHHGRIEANGKPKDILSNPNYCIENGFFPPQIYELFFELRLPERPASVEEAKDILDGKGFVVKRSYEDPETVESHGPPIITAQDVYYSYNPQVQALRNISLEIKNGDFVCILGRNGSGKTTLVKHFNGFLTPQSGRVYFDGIHVDRFPRSKMGRNIGYVFQNPDHMLFAENVFEEVAFGLRNYGIDKGSILKKVSAALEAVGLLGKEEEDPFIMTKGDRQKLAVACVLACEPQVLILDEPTTGLDAKEQIQLMELLKHLHMAGHTIIIITHSVNIAAAYAHRVILIDSGRIVQDSTAREIFRKPDLLGKAGLVAPYCSRLGALYGLSVLTPSEMTQALERRKS